MFAEAHGAFVRHDYSRAAAAYTTTLDSGRLTSAERVVALCNRSATYAEMDLNRKALKDAEAALAEDSACARAWILKGVALHSMGREEDAVCTWREGASLGVGDVLLVAELTKLSTGSSGSSASSQSAVAVAPAPTAAATRSAPVPAPVPAHALAPGPAHAPVSVPPASAHAPAPVPRPSTAPPNGAAPANPATKASAQRLASSSAALSAEVSAKAAVKMTRRPETLEQAVLAANRGDYTRAISLFTTTLEQAPAADRHTIDALAGRGTAHAYSGELVKALRDFDDGLKLTPRSADLLSRRVQVLSALERHEEVVRAATTLLQIDHRDASALHQRAKAYNMLRNYKRAVADFERLLGLGRTHGGAQVFNLLGTALAALGRCTEAVEAYHKTLEHDPSLYQAYVNLGQACRDLAEVEAAEKYFTQALTMQPDFWHALHRRALLRLAVGDHAGAIVDLARLKHLQPRHLEARDLLAMCHVALGQFAVALREFDGILSEDPTHWAIHHRGVALILWRCQDEPACDGGEGLDARVCGEIRLGTAKQLSCSSAEEAKRIRRLSGEEPAATASFEEQPPPCAPLAPPCGVGEQASLVLSEALPFARRMQVRHPGFVPNARLQRQAGVAVIDVAQRVRSLLVGAASRAREGEGGGGGGASEAGRKAAAAQGWRNIFDVAVRWRQLGEPYDNVWWIDGMPRKDFAEGFGSHTPILKGQHETVRYFQHHDRVLQAMRRLAPEQWNLNEEQRKEYEGAADCLALRRLRGRDDYVVSPCHGLVGGTLEGTRLTIQDRPPEGVDLSIRTPLTPARWSAYEPEMRGAWEHFCEVGCAVHAAKGGGGGGSGGGGGGALGGANAPPSERDLLDAALRLAFFWFNFMPLTRGSAAVGWSMLMALLLSCDIEVTEPPPRGVCPDWEAILTPTFEQFASGARAWLGKSCRSRAVPVDRLPEVSEVFGTFRRMIDALTPPAAQ
jgi:tetratricopeptide (TPR) repeat protein